MGNLAIKKGWPAMMRKIWNNPEKYESYFMNDEWYVSGDSAYMDEDGYFWFQGRVDDVIMTSGERVGLLKLKVSFLNIRLSLKQELLVNPIQYAEKLLKHLLRFMKDMNHQMN